MSNEEYAVSVVPPSFSKRQVHYGGGGRDFLFCSRLRCDAMRRSPKRKTQLVIARLTESTKENHSQKVSKTLLSGGSSSRDELCNGDRWGTFCIRCHIWHSGS